MGAARRLDADAAAAVVAVSLARRGVVRTWDELCRLAITHLDRPDRPGLDMPGLDTAAGCVEAELLLCWAVATSLRRLPAPPAAAGAWQVLLASSEGEHHTLALEALHAALLERYVDVRMLGPSVPDPALRSAVGSLRPDAVVVWSQVPDTASSALLATLRERTEIVVAAGPGWCGIRLGPSIAVVRSLSEALHVTSRSASP